MRHQQACEETETGKDRDQRAVFFNDLIKPDHGEIAEPDEPFAASLRVDMADDRTEAVVRARQQIRVSLGIIKPDMGILDIRNEHQVFRGALKFACSEKGHRIAVLLEERDRADAFNPVERNAVPERAAIGKQIDGIGGTKV